MRTVDPWTALADPTRRGLLDRVARTPSSVTELAADLPISRPAVSQHLKLLLDSDLVTVHKSGRQRIYHARPETLAGLRAELDAFWTQALANFKEIVETSATSEEE